MADRRGGQRNLRRIRLDGLSHAVTNRDVPLSVCARSSSRAASLRTSVGNALGNAPDAPPTRIADPTGDQIDGRWDVAPSWASGALVGRGYARAGRDCEVR